MKQKIIAVDIDDVLSVSAEAFARFSNTRWGTRLTAEDYDENFAKVWGLPIEEAKARAEEFLTSGIHGKYKHVEEAVPVLHNLKQHFKLVVVTSRRRMLKEVTDTWIDTYFNGIFDDIVYAGHFDDPKLAHTQLHQTKAQLCLDLKADFLIDDQPKHCLAAAECGIQALLFGGYVWSRNLKNKPKNLTIVHTWQEVERYFYGKN